MSVEKVSYQNVAKILIFMVGHFALFMHTNSKKQVLEIHDNDDQLLRLNRMTYLVSCCYHPILTMGSPPNRLPTTLHSSLEASRWMVAK